MTHKAVPPVIITHVGEQEAGHKSGKTARVVEPNQEVHMVAHEAVVIEVETNSLPIMPQELEKPASIIVAGTGLVFRPLFLGALCALAVSRTTP
jgi:hypothetical protein